VPFPEVQIRDSHSSGGKKYSTASGRHTNRPIEHFEEPASNVEGNAMKKIAFAAALLTAIAAAPAGAVTLSTANGSLDAFNASAADAQFTFESAATPTGFVRTGGLVMSGNVSGQGANPFPAPANNAYLAVMANAQSTIASVATFYKTISFYMGSIDEGNMVEVLGADGSVIAKYSGKDLAAPASANGSQTQANTNRAISFTAGAGEALTGLRFSSSVNSLEADNVRFSAAVPEPATWAMMLLGFGMIGAGMRQRSRKVSATLAVAGR
jgi:hypothetical protein